MEFEELSKQLQIKATGANVHTANKARMYLRQFVEQLEKDASKFADGSLDRFVTLIRGAVYRNEWKPLEERMSGWR